MDYASFLSRASSFETLSFLVSSFMMIYPFVNCLRGPIWASPLKPVVKHAVYDRLEYRFLLQVVIGYLLC